VCYLIICVPTTLDATVIVTIDLDSSLIDSFRLLICLGAQSDMIPLPASNDMTVFGGSIEPIEDEQRGDRKSNRSRGASRGKSPDNKGRVQSPNSDNKAASNTRSSGNNVKAIASSASQPSTRATTAATNAPTHENHDPSSSSDAKSPLADPAAARDENDIEAMARAVQMERRNARSAAKMLAVAKQV
jgi:hypothetical protein